MDIARPDISIKKRRKRIVTGAVVVIALTAVTVVLARLKPAVPSIEKATISWDVVKRGEMLREVRGNGTLVPVDIRWVPASTSGRIEKILVEAGESVEPDTVLIELSDPVSEQDAVSAKAQFNAEQANLENLRVQVESARLTQQAAVATAESNYKQAKLDFDVNEELGKSGLVADLTVNQSKAKAEELKKLFEIETERMEMTPRSAKAQLMAQEAKVEQLRTEYERKRQQVESLKVRAGIKGVVQKLGDDSQTGQGSSGGMTLQSGQQIVAGANLARISDPTRLKAQIKVAETQVRDVARGQTVAVDTRNGIIPGHVTRVAPAAENGVVNVDVALDGPLPRGTRPDQSVDGTIELERLENVLYVGRPVNGQPDSKVSIFKVIDGGSGAMRVPVKLGRSSVSSIEILEGLNAGDQIALSDMSTYDNQDNIRLY
ncbi:MAG TPA: HlyD family efflux transporter periplasmic adaptor subunit [Verrucomicrobiae bacterium]|jgi:HlyD family secretion protein